MLRTEKGWYFQSVTAISMTDKDENAIYCWWFLSLPGPDGRVSDIGGTDAGGCLDSSETTTNNPTLPLPSSATRPHPPPHKVPPKQGGYGGLGITRMSWGREAEASRGIKSTRPRTAQGQTAVRT
eukprot:284991-Hanusia_phi.AAC.1